MNAVEQYEREEGRKEGAREERDRIIGFIENSMYSWPDNPQVRAVLRALIEDIKEDRR